MARYKMLWFLAGLLFLTGCHTPSDRPLVQDFLRDTAAITRLTLTDGTDTTHIRKEKNIWQCNGHMADVKLVQHTLLNLRRLQLYSPAEFGTSFDGVADIELWLFKENKALHLTLTDQGSYTLLVYPEKEVAQQVFLPESPLPIARRIPVSPGAWAAEKLFTVEVSKVQTVSLTYPQKDASEWQAKIKENHWYLEKQAGTTEGIDPAFMADYLFALQSVDARLANPADSLHKRLADTLALLTIGSSDGRKLSFLAQDLESSGHISPATVGPQLVAIKATNTGNYFITKYIDYDLIFIPAESWLLIKK